MSFSYISKVFENIRMQETSIAKKKSAFALRGSDARRLGLTTICHAREDIHSNSASVASGHQKEGL